MRGRLLVRALCRAHNRCVAPCASVTGSRKTTLDPDGGSCALLLAPCQQLAQKGMPASRPHYLRAVRLILLAAVIAAIAVAAYVVLGKDANADGVSESATTAQEQGDEVPLGDGGAPISTIAIDGHYGSIFRQAQLEYAEGVTKSKKKLVAALKIEVASAPIGAPIEEGGIQVRLLLEGRVLELCTQLAAGVVYCQARDFVTQKIMEAAQYPSLDEAHTASDEFASGLAAQTGESGA